MLVLALDLASRQSGWAICDDKDNKVLKTGIIAPRPLSLSAAERLPIILEEFRTLLSDFYPKRVILEIPAGGAEDSNGPEKNWLTMSVLFMCHGVIQCELVSRKIKFELVSPSTWQYTIGIHKRDRASRKAGAKKYAIETLGLSPKLEQDEYDAACLFAAYQHNKTIDKEERSAF